MPRRLTASLLRALVKATVCDKCGVGAIIEVNSETDFVAKNADFQQFVSDLAAVVIKDAPADVEALKACKMGEAPFRTLSGEGSDHRREPADPSFRAFRRLHR
ncbi:MAG: hypothetical protein ACLR4Z_08920 [Butyricicoccaceae bacterium]